jgi:selenocysteine lyase/cysteine desulfurase
VIARVQNVLSDYSQYGVQAFLRWEEQRNTLRGELAELVGARPTEIGFVSNTSAGVTDIALSFPWRTGDRVVLFEREFPANVTPWQRAAELFGLELVFLPPAAFETDEGTELLRAELERGVRLVAVSVVQFQTGLRMPIRAMGALCHRFGAQLFVDAIQACGAIPLHVLDDHIDYLASGSHKWLMGMEGAGFLFVRHEHQPTLRPYTAGWLSHTHATDFLFHGAGHLRTDRELRQDAAVFEGGTQSLLALAALGASVPLLRQLGTAGIFEHVTGYIDLLEPALLDLGFRSLRAATRDRQSTLLCVVPPAGKTSAFVAGELRRAGVSVATPDGNLRFSPHFPNAYAEIPLVVAATKAALEAAD